MSDEQMKNLIKTLSAEKIKELVRSDKVAKLVYKSINWIELAKYRIAPEGIVLREKSEQIQIFIDYFSDLPPQGSAAWRKQREGAHTLPPTIGGSEIGDVTRSTPSAKKEFYKKKLGLSRFAGNVYTQWGNLFEPMIQLYCDTVLHTKTFETGSIPGLVDESGNVIQSYSPDGVNLIDINNYVQVVCASDASDISADRLREKHTREYKNRDVFINLMEFKCPPTRIPNGIVPDNYYSQPRVGACTIDIVDACLFVDAAFRRCSYEQFIDPKAHDLTQYNRDSSLHRHDRDNSFSSKCYPMGMIGIYDTSKSYKRENVYELFSGGPGGPGGSPNNEQDFLDEFNLDDIASELEKLAQRTNTQATIQTEDEDLIEPLGIADLLKSSVHTPASIAECIQKSGPMYKSRIVSITQQVWRYIEDECAYISDDIADDVWNIIMILIPSFKENSPGQCNMYKAIIKDTIRLCMNEDAIQNYYDCGEDFGIPKNNQYFTEVLRRSIDERYALKGFKIFYPQKIIHASTDNSTDTTNKEYMNKQMWMFLRECRIRNAKPIGIIPWKLMKVSIIPIEKDPNFLKNIEEKVRQAARDIHQIRIATHILPPDQMIEKRAQLIEQYCPVKSRGIRAARDSPASSGPRAASPPIDDESDVPTALPDEQSLSELGDL